MSLLQLVWLGTFRNPFGTFQSSWSINATHIDRQKPQHICISKGSFRNQKRLFMFRFHRSRSSLGRVTIIIHYYDFFHDCHKCMTEMHDRNLVYNSHVTFNCEDLKFTLVLLYILSCNKKGTLKNGEGSMAQKSNQYSKYFIAPLSLH